MKSHVSWILLGLFALFTPAHGQLVPGSGTGLSVDANTVALFRFEDSAATAVDSAGNNRDATVTNTTVGSGLFGSGRVFNGTSDRLELGNAFNAVNGASGWTIEYFAKSNDGSNAPFLISHNPSAGWYIQPRSSDILFWIKTSATGNSWTAQSTATGVTLGTGWHYYAMTWTPGTISMYRDGVLVGTDSAGGTWGGSNSFGVYLDFDTFSSTYGGAGVIDDLRFSSVARTGTEISAAYLAAIPETSALSVMLGLGVFSLALARRCRAQGVARPERGIANAR